MGVKKGVKGHSIPPTLVEILDVDVFVPISLPLTPQQQRLLGLLLRTRRIAVRIGIFGNLDLNGSRYQPMIAPLTPTFAAHNGVYPLSSPGYLEFEI